MSVWEEQDNRNDSIEDEDEISQVIDLLYYSLL